MADLCFLLNGERVTLPDPDPRRTLLDWLRCDRGMTGTKEGCNEGDCGACTVILGTGDGARAVNACILLLGQLHGKSVRTVEGLAAGEALHPVQAAMIEHHASQCGFCTPGIVMSLVAAHREGRADHDDVLAGNLCRCTGYAPIIRAGEAAEATPVPGWFDTDADAARDIDTDMGCDWPGGYWPRNLDEFAKWYAKHPDALLIGGATDVGLWLTKQLREPRQMAFLGGLDDLRIIEALDDGILIGAGVSIEDLRRFMVPLHPDFANMLRRFGSVQVRNAATVGGNIANGSPIGDGAPALIALGATLTLRQGRRYREIPLEDFFLDYGEQDIRPGEFVDHVMVPAQADALKCYKLSKRLDQDISAVCGCFNIHIVDGVVQIARIAFGGMAATPKRAYAVERTLEGAPWGDETMRAARRAFEQDFAPISDMRASAEYRMAAAKNMLTRYFAEHELGPGLARLDLVAP